MKITATSRPLHRISCDIVILTHFEDDTRPRGAAEAIDGHTGGLLTTLLEEGDFRGRLFETSLLYTHGLITSKRILIIGMGKRKDLDLERIRSAYAKASRKARELRRKTCAASVSFDETGLTLEQTARAAVEGALLGLYRFIPYKSSDPDLPADMDEFIVTDERPSMQSVLRHATETAEITARAVSITRDLVSSPAGELTPAALAKKARETLRGRDVSVTVIDEKGLKKLGMNALLGVGRGSAETPRLIVMSYRGARRKERPLVLVGKGITFDSGGLNLKSAEAMADMKDDMAGGAAVIGTMRAAADLRIPAPLVGIVPAAENLPGGRAYKPGDVLTSLSGTSIEITNTDAEGRLILADALTYAQRYTPEAIIDIATLTGACAVALGNGISGVLGTDDRLMTMIKDAGKETGEPVWELPLWPEYEEMLKSDIADLKNSAGRQAGAITAALFLKRFTGAYPWVHIDIAGTATLAKEKPSIPKGASGVGVRLLVRFIQEWARMRHGSHSFH